MSRGLDGSARARAPAARRDLAREARLAVRPDGDGAARAAVRRRVGAQSRAVRDAHVRGVCERPRPLPAAADLDRAALHAARIRQAARAEVHVTRRDADRARRVCEGGGTDDAVLIDRRAREHFARRRRHKDKASVCLDETFVRDRLLQCRLGGDDLDLAVAAKVECDGLARGEGRRALLRDDDALVDDVLAEEGDEPAVLGGERCLVDDLAVVLCADEVVASRHEVRVRDVHGGGDDRARIDLCARGEVDARRVDEEDASVRLQLSEDLGRVAAEDTVQEGRLCVRLEDAHALARCDIEGLPVDDGVLRVLMDRHLCRVRGDLCVAGGDLSALRKGKYGLCRARQ